MTPDIGRRFRPRFQTINPSTPRTSLKSPPEHPVVYRPGSTLMPSGGYLLSGATTESVLATHVLERTGLAWAGSRNTCQFHGQNRGQNRKVSLGHNGRIASYGSPTGELRK